MAELKGSKTEQNLLKAFAGESQARNRYTYAASVARKEGYRQIEAIFLETAENEREHAKRFFKFLEGGNVEITATYPAGKTLTTAENLEAAADGEHEEWAELYPAFAATAKEEGFADIAACFLGRSRFLPIFALEGYQHGNPFSELLPEVFYRHVGVFNGVVQRGSSKQFLVGGHGGNDFHRLHGMNDVREAFPTAFGAGVGFDRKDDSTV